MRDLLHPDPATLETSSAGAIGRTALITALGFGLYGFTVGFWKSPVMGGFVAIKMPLLIACTLGCNGILNGLLGLLLGSGLGFKQSLHALLGAFAISGLILGSIAPVTFFFALNAPAHDSADAANAHATYLLFHTTLIGIAGIAGVMRLSDLLHDYCASRSIAHSTLAAWITGNAFLGMQFSWILRPFFGSPGLKVEFFREDPMKGSFLEAVWRSILNIINRTTPEEWAILGFLAIITAMTALSARSLRRRRLSTPSQP